MLSGKLRSCLIELQIDNYDELYAEMYQKSVRKFGLFKHFAKDNFCLLDISIKDLTGDN